MSNENVGNETTPITQRNDPTYSPEAKKQNILD